MSKETEKLWGELERSNAAYTGLALCFRRIQAALDRAVEKIHNFEGHKRTPEAIRDELMGGSDENKTR